VIKRVVYIGAVVFGLALACHFGARIADSKPTSTLLAMTDNPRIPSSAIAIDQSGAIYSGQLSHWTRVGSTPSAPASLWSRSSTGEVFIALTNGDLFRLESNWTLTFDSNVFSSQ
jgi:hypothetical protein